MNKRRIGTVVVLLLVVLSGCSGGANVADGGDGGSGGQSANVAAEATAGSGGGSSDGGGEGGGRPQASEGSTAGGGTNAQVTVDGRILIRTGTVALEVDDYDSARRNLSRAVERHGGYVSDSAERNDQYGNETRTTGSVVLRVPKENFSALMDDTEAEGKVLEATTQTEDVTDRVVDLRARLENLRAERDRLRTLYERANDTQTVLQVAERLSEVQGEIERTEAKLQSLERRVAYSTLTVELREPHPDPSVYRTDDRWYDTPLVTAFLDSVSGVGVALRATAVGFAYALPYLVVFGAPVALVGFLLVRRFR